MAQFHVQVLGQSGRVAVPSFVDGGRVRVAPRLTRKETEPDAMARALWLENHGREEEALAHLDAFFRANPDRYGRSN